MLTVPLGLIGCSSPDSPAEATGSPTPSTGATGATGATGTLDTGTPPPTEGSFTALTYNVHGLPDALTGDDGNARMNAIAPLIEGFDIVGLQETFDPDKHELLTAASTHEVHTWFDDKVEDGRAYGSGLAVLSRVGTLVEVFEEHYEQCHGVLDSSSDCLASKGFQVVRLDLGGGVELDVYNTHHEAGGEKEDEAVRATQVDQVIASMDGRSAGRAILFMGDTNLRPSDAPDAEQLARYAAAGLRDACVEVGCAEADHIDRFLLRDSDALQLTVEGWANEPAFYDGEGVPLSDHPAISAVVGWALR